MRIDWSFPKQIILALAVIGLLGAYPLLRFGSSEVTNAAIVGAVLATVNVLLGYAAIEYSFGKSTTTFLKYVLGGMGVRMFVMAGVLVVLLKVVGLHVVALVTSLGIFYTIFLALELLYMQKKYSHKN